MENPEVDFKQYEKHYDEPSFWEKIKKFAGKAGSKVIYAALKLFYAAQSEATPGWAKTVIYGALGYFILPVDVVPDVLPGVGFLDDLGILLAAIAAVAIHITPEVKAMAKQKMIEWFNIIDIEHLD